MSPLREAIEGSDLPRLQALVMVMPHLHIVVEEADASVDQADGQHSQGTEVPGPEEGDTGDKDGDQHYDTISAFIKSMRGSDPDAAVFYLAKMLAAGEDIRFIARRIMICASEDVGNADPQALQVAVAASQAVERIGLPESQIILAHAAIYVASAPKSNSVVNAIFAANEAVRSRKTTVPVHLQDAHYGGHDELGHGVGYQYAHDFPNHYVEQQYLPDEVAGMRFYEPSENGYENVIREWFRKIGKEI